MVKMEIDLTEKQAEKVEILKQNDIDVGQAIDMLFEIKDKAMSEIENIDEEEIGIFERVKDSTFDIGAKAANLEENYGDSEKTYEMKVQDVKHKISWAKDFFKF